MQWHNFCGALPALRDRHVDSVGTLLRHFSHSGHVAQMAPLAAAAFRRQNPFPVFQFIVTRRGSPYGKIT